MRQSWIPPWPSTTATFQRSVTTSPATKSRQKKRQFAPIWPSSPIVNRRARTSTSSADRRVVADLDELRVDQRAPADRHALADLGPVLAVERDLLVGRERRDRGGVVAQAGAQLVGEPAERRHLVGGLGSASGVGQRADVALADDPGARHVVERDTELRREPPRRLGREPVTGRGGDLGAQAVGGPAVALLLGREQPAELGQHGDAVADPGVPEDEAGSLGFDLLHRLARLHREERLARLDVPVG